MASTVRGWLRRFGLRASAIREHFTRWGHALGPGHDRLWPDSSVFWIFVHQDVSGEFVVVRQQVTVRKSPQAMDGKRVARGVLELSALKTGSKGRRTLELTPEVIELLQGHRALQDRERATAGAAWQERGLIFTAPAGAPIEPSSFSHAFSAMAQRAGLGRWNVHEARHTAASLMLAMGTKLEIVSRVLGHSSVTVTADVYGAWGPLGHLPNFAFPAPQFVHAAATGTTDNLSGVAGRLKADDGLDLCYVYDLGRATALLQTADTLTHTTYNVAAGKLTTNAEVIAAIKSIVPGFDVELEPGSSAPPSYLDITRLHHDTGYQPEWDTERSVADYIAYFRAGNAQ